MNDDSGYVMANARQANENTRLGLLEAVGDPGTIRRLHALGVGKGWRCLEAGAGRGSIARWLAHRVGRTGSVVAADIDPSFLSTMPANVEVRTLDIRVDEIGADEYDLIHCRALLMHVPDPAAALGRLAGGLRPGGLLFAEEGDYGIYHYGGTGDADELNARGRDALEAMTRARIMDAYLGRRLPAMMAACGLELHLAEVNTPFSQPGDPAYEFARASALDSLPMLISAGVIPEASGARLEEFFNDLDSMITGPSLVAVCGRRSG